MGVKETLLQHSAKIWFPVAVAALHALDTYILIVPNDVFLVAAVLAQPQRWAAIAVIQTLGCLLGCLSFCFIAYYDPEGVKERYPSVFESESWQQTEVFFKDYGLGASLVLASVLPIHPFLFVGAFSGMSVIGLVGSIVVGRLIRNLGLCFSVVKGQSLTGSSLSREKQS